MTKEKTETKRKKERKGSRKAKTKERKKGKKKTGRRKQIKKYSSFFGKYTEKLLFFLSSERKNPGICCLYFYPQIMYNGAKFLPERKAGTKS